MHKIITIWIGRGSDSQGRRKNEPMPYAHTGTSFSQSIVDIKALLQKFNCQTIIDYQSKGHDPKYGEISLNTIGFEKDNLKYLIEFPVTFVEHSQGKRLNMDVSGRIIYNRIKAQLIDVEIGYLSFHEAMLSNLALPSPHGTITIMEAVQSQIGEIQKGTAGLFRLTSGGAP